MPNPLQKKFDNLVKSLQMDSKNKYNLVFLHPYCNLYPKDNH